MALTSNLPGFPTYDVFGSIDDSSEPKNVKVNYLENAIEANMAGKEINPNQTKAIGCGIKAKK